MDSVFLNGEPVRISGFSLQPDADAPDFVLVGRDLSEIRLGDLKGRRVVLNIFPSLDTEVCAASVRRFNKEVAGFPETEVLCVSMDLPFAAQRFCTVNDITHVRPASAFRSAFGKDYGLEITDGPLRGLLARALVIIDVEGKVSGVSVCREITEEPDYDFARKILG